MANTASAKKRIRQNEKRRQRNRVYLTQARTFVKRARQAIAVGDPDQASEAVRTAISVLDRAASKGVIHRNNAARRKRRLMKQFASMQSSSSPE